MRMPAARWKSKLARRTMVLRRNRQAFRRCSALPYRREAIAASAARRPRAASPSVSPPSETQPAQWCLRVGHAKAGCALEAKACTSHHSLALKERGLPPVSRPSVSRSRSQQARHGACAASSRVSPPPERQPPRFLRFRRGTSSRRSTCRARTRSITSSITSSTKSSTTTSRRTTSASTGTPPLMRVSRAGPGSCGIVLSRPANDDTFRTRCHPSCADDGGGPPGGGLYYAVSSHFISSRLMSSRVVLRRLVSSRLAACTLVSSSLVSCRLVSSHVVSSCLVLSSSPRVRTTAADGDRGGGGLWHVVSSHVVSLGLVSFRVVSSRLVSPHVA